MLIRRSSKMLAENVDCSPETRDESQLIERAECLAAIAIQRHNETAQQSNCVICDGDPLQQRLLEEPVSVN
jgi:hypothetical protein